MAELLDQRTRPGAGRLSRIAHSREAPKYWPPECIWTDAVRAFEPADEEPDAANDVEAPAPLAPEEALDRM